MGTISIPITPERRLSALINSLKPLQTENSLIRVGPNGDGGYLVPDDLSGIEACFSPGVERVSGFEKDCADIGMNVYMADYSVEHPALDDSRFHFVKNFISSTNHGKYITMDAWVNQAKLSDESDLILQMDIEGSEYETIFSMSDDLMQRWRVMVIEFHFLDMLYSSTYFRLVCRAFLKILNTHACVHIHPNNCCGVKHEIGYSIPPVMEFTFYRKDRFNSSGLVNSFPHALDFDNTSKPSLVLPKCWYGQ